jgi:Zn-dependent protease with chaperone function
LLDQQNTQEGARAGAQLGQIAVQMFAPKYSQGQELQADAYAVRVLRAEGYQRGGDSMANTLALLEEMAGPSGGGFFDTHPSFEDRIKKLRGR